MIVSDLDDVFLPIQPDDLLVNLRDSRTIIDSLLQLLPGMFKENREVNSCLGAALQAAYKLVVCSALSSDLRTPEVLYLHSTQSEER